MSLILDDDKWYIGRIVLTQFGYRRNRTRWIWSQFQLLRRCSQKDADSVTFFFNTPYAHLNYRGIHDAYKLLHSPLEELHVYTKSRIGSFGLNLDPIVNFDHGHNILHLESGDCSMPEQWKYAWILNMASNKPLMFPRFWSVFLENDLFTVGLCSDKYYVSWKPFRATKAQNHHLIPYRPSGKWDLITSFIANKFVYKFLSILLVFRINKSIESKEMRKDGGSPKFESI